ncbi:substrate-binding periplasmic protein [Salinispira pacifica]|uniref:Extracellular solute-binding protein, family 3 n=1 Tax=Salinispira pacifica TaxID=1307761 RepID=V5WGK0_9SPIO|nr:transporter substrate-binding domain-containing protein [Salinispira pacifica]AHC14291.1 extracellular solute-binding protein, family 3 [Salinispira pacifica]
MGKGRVTFIGCGIVLATVFLTLQICSCGADTPRADSVESDDSPVSGFQELLNDRERAYLSRLQDAGEIRFAVINAPESYYMDENGEYRGFDYVYAGVFAEMLGVSAEFYEQEQITDFFARNGKFDSSIISKPEISYVPDLMDDVDVYAAPFGINEWRRRLVSMTPFFPVGVVMIGPEASGIESYNDLDGLAAAVRPGDFQIPMLQSIMEEHGVSIRLIEYEADEDVFTVLREGRADITIDGSLFLARTVQELGDMQVSPLTLSLVPVGWAVDPREEELTSILEKFVAYTLENGTFATVWEREMGMNFDYYLDLVSTQE